jgi:hypothetical protein
VVAWVRSEQRFRAMVVVSDLLTTDAAPCNRYSPRAALTLSAPKQ